MNTQLNQPIRDLRGMPAHAIGFTTNWSLKERFPDCAIIETDDPDFAVDYFAAHGHCALSPSEELHPEISTKWNDDTNSAYVTIENALFDVAWDGHEFRILRLTFPEDGCTKKIQWLIGDNKQILDTFFATVCAWQPPTEPSVEVFQDGYWHDSRTLHRAIKSSTLDNLILAEGLKEELKTDLAHFFGSREIYDRYGIPWKRGVLLSGPPGNGKTHAVKSLINWLDRPALYVKSLKSQHYTEHTMMHSVFSRARTVAPCVLVFEDLESIVTPLNRSYFLNELDGFALNTGILVLATTNHPELLDAAITERPSRFDRKYNFDLPAHAERARYLAQWNEKIEDELKLSEPGIATVADKTEGFSFAFLKELLMASMMRWINLPEKPSMDSVMAAQTVVLRAQMANSISPAPDVITDSEEALDD